MERCVYKHVYNILLKNSIITPHQPGFTPADSAIFCFNFFGYLRKIIALCHFYHIIAFIPGYAILSPMVNRICMFCFFMDSIFPMYQYLDICSFQICCSVVHAVYGKTIQ
jgi:hypothetical protein